MGYAARFLREPRFWVRVIGLPALAALNIADIMTAILAAPGVFRLWVVRITLVGGLVFAVSLAVRDTKKQHADRDLAASQKEFETRMMNELRQRVVADPQYQTLCFRCRHFNPETTACGLEILNAAARRVRLDDSQYRYCLYWESAAAD